MKSNKLLLILYGFSLIVFHCQAVMAKNTGNYLTSANVDTIIAQAFQEASKGNNKAVTVAVVDRVGNVLGVFQSTAAANPDPPTAPGVGIPLFNLVDLQGLVRRRNHYWVHKELLRYLESIQQHKSQELVEELEVVLKERRSLQLWLQSRKRLLLRIFLLQKAMLFQVIQRLKLFKNISILVS